MTRCNYFIKLFPTASIANFLSYIQNKAIRHLPGITDEQINWCTRMMSVCLKIFERKFLNRWAGCNYNAITGILRYYHSLTYREFQGNPV